MPEEFEASVEQSYRSLIRKIEDAHMLLDYGRIRAAFELAARAHAGQKRKDGSPYVTHAVAAADIASVCTIVATSASAGRNSVATSPAST